MQSRASISTMRTPGTHFAGQLQTNFTHDYAPTHDATSVYWLPQRLESVGARTGLGLELAHFIKRRRLGTSATHRVPELSDEIPPVQAISLEWYFKAVSLPSDKDVDIQEIAQFLRGFMSLISKSQFDVISKLISDEGTVKLPSGLIVSLLRILHTFRGQFSGWNALLETSKSVLNERGLQPQVLLRGII